MAVLFGKCCAADQTRSRQDSNRGPETNAETAPSGVAAEQLPAERPGGARQGFDQPGLRRQPEHPAHFPALDLRAPSPG